MERSGGDAGHSGAPSARPVLPRIGRRTGGCSGNAPGDSSEGRGDGGASRVTRSVPASALGARAVHGTIVRDAEGRPESMQNVTLVGALDLSPIRVDRFVVGSQDVSCVPRLELAVDFHPANGMLTAADADLGIDAYGETRDRLAGALLSELDVLWRYYTGADRPRGIPWSSAEAFVHPSNSPAI